MERLEFLGDATGLDLSAIARPLAGASSHASMPWPLATEQNPAAHRVAPAAEGVSGVAGHRGP